MSKLLKSSDAWVTALCKKLDQWWPWVRQNFAHELPAFYAHLDHFTSFILICLIILLLQVAEGEIPLTARNGY